VLRYSRTLLKCDGTGAETRFRLSPKRKSQFNLSRGGRGGVSIQSTTGSRGVHISLSNAGYNIFRGSVKSTGYPIHSPVSLSLPSPCVTVCHHISTGIYLTGLVLFSVNSLKKCVKICLALLLQAVTSNNSGL